MDAMAPTMTILGGSGYVGRHLSAHLSELGYNCWVPQRADAELLTRPLGTVFYCAGLTADFRSRPFDTVDAHIGLLSEVLQYAHFDSLLYLSSTRVYMGAAATQEDALLSVRPGDPSYLYNLTKLTGESLCHASGRSGVRVVRLSNVVGSDMESSNGNFIASLLSEARTGHIVLRSDLESSKDYIHIDDVVRGLPLIAFNGRSSIYNLANGKNTTHREWMDWMRRNNGCSFSVELNAPLQNFPVIEMDRMELEFGFRTRPVLDFCAISIEK
jgi:nucleoside-diphosphate-sugar epimerase